MMDRKALVRISFMTILLMFGIPFGGWIFAESSARRESLSKRWMGFLRTL